ncbi:MAG: transposase family protein [Ruminococcus sp.]|nr:transposase family protein [Ruminococcus sp.]
MSERQRARRLPIELAEIIDSRQTADYERDSESLKTRLCSQLLRDVLQNGLTKKQKCYIILYYRDRLTMEQIANKYGVNRSTVSRTINAARRRINARVSAFMNMRI